MFHGIFKPGFMSGYDNSLHLFDAYFQTTTLIPRYYWISGWSMQGMAGFPVFVDYYQVTFLLIAALNKLFFLPLNFSYKIMVLLSYAFLGAGFYKMCSSRFGRTGSLFATLCLMLQKDIYLERILGGLWTNYFAIGLLCIFFHVLDEHITNLTLRKAGILAFLLGALILSHVFVAIFAFLLLFIYFIPYAARAFKERRFFTRTSTYAVMPVLAFMISAYYLRNFIVAKDYFNVYPSKELFTGIVWGLKSIFGPIVYGGEGALARLVLNLPIIARGVFALSGIYLFFTKQKSPGIKRFLASTLALMVFSVVLFSDIFVNTFDWWRAIPFVGNLQTTRFIVYAQLGMYIFSAYGIGRFLAHFTKKRKQIMTFAALLLFLSASFHYFYLARERSRTLAESPVMPEVYRVWDWVNGNIPPESQRIVYQSTMWNMEDPILGRSDVFALSGIFTRVPQIGVTRPASPFPQEKYMRNDQHSIFSRKIDTVDDVFIKDMMNHFNSGHIVSVEPGLEEKLKKSAFFSKKDTFSPFTIFGLKNFRANWVTFEKNASYKTLNYEDQNLAFEINNTSRDNRALVKVAYHPLWEARLNKKPAKIEQDRYHMMTFSLPEEGNYLLELSFAYFNPFWVSVSFFSILFGVTIIVRMKT